MQTHARPLAAVLDQRRAINQASFSKPIQNRLYNAMASVAGAHKPQFTSRVTAVDVYRSTVGARSSNHGFLNNSTTAFPA